MKLKDKEILNEILCYIGSDPRMESELAKFVAKPRFDMTEEEFSHWLMTFCLK